MFELVRYGRLCCLKYSTNHRTMFIASNAAGY